MFSKDQVKRLNQVKDAIRKPYAWPGGYALVVILADGEALHPDCARNNWADIARSTLGQYHNGWAAAGVDIHFEGPDLYCAHCGDPIPSEYGDPWA